MSFVAFNVITDDDLHESLPRPRRRDSKLNSASAPAEGGGSSGVSSAPQPHAGAAAAFNLDACMKMGEGFER